jgi:hypothetical protein
LLLYDQDAAQCSGGSTPPKGPARKAGRESDTVRRGAGESGKARKTSSLGRRENRVTQLQIESNLRGKRSDPLHGANARPKAGAVPVARCWCEMPPLQACQHPSGERAIGRWRRTGRRGLTRKIPVRKRPGRSRHETESCACLGPSETKAETPARTKGFWNRLDATAMPSRWRDESRAIFGLLRFQTGEAVTAQSRQGRTFRSGAEVFAEPSGKAETVRGPGRKTGLGTAGRPWADPRDHTRVPDGTGTGASAGRWKRRSRGSSQEWSSEAVLKTPGVKRPSGPTRRSGLAGP